MWTEVSSSVDRVWNVMAHAQKPDFVFRRNGRVHLNRRVRQFSRLLAAEVCASAVVMLDTPCSEVVWRTLVTHSILQFPLHFSFRASPCAITFQLGSTSFPTSWVITQPHYIFEVLYPVSRPITTLDCVLVKDNNRALCSQVRPTDQFPNLSLWTVLLGASAQQRKLPVTFLMSYPSFWLSFLMF
jgi:hypothetical protein